jgi:aspartyl-tRNA synthetase
MASVDRYIVERGTDQVPTAFRGMVKLAKEKGIANITLVVPKKGGWEHTIIAKFLGEAVAKALAKGQSVKVVDGVTMALDSAQTFRATTGQGLLVGAHISIKDMAKLDDSWGAQAIMYLPWIDAEAQEWKATWHAQTIGPKSEEAQPSSLSKPVEEALTRLTDLINLSTGLGHPSDKQHAERTFEKLRSEGHSFDPAEIRRWAQRNNWSSGAAADLEAVARKKK